MLRTYFDMWIFLFLPLAASSFFRRRLSRQSDILNAICITNTMQPKISDVI